MSSFCSWPGDQLISPCPCLAPVLNLGSAYFSLPMSNFCSWPKDQLIAPCPCLSSSCSWPGISWFLPAHVYLAPSLDLGSADFSLPMSSFWTWPGDHLISPCPWLASAPDLGISWFLPAHVYLAPALDLGQLISPCPCLASFLELGISWFLPAQV